MLEGKVVFITGACGSIGYSIGLECLKHQAKVVFSDILESKLQEKTAHLIQAGQDCLGIPCDVTKATALKEAINGVVDKYGKIDVLINNAGMQHVAPLEDFPAERFEYLIRLMLIAPFTATKCVIPVMKRQRWGRIINIASINGLIGFAGKAAYNSAKHGVIGLTKVAALETAEHGITVNALCPGYVDTPLVRGQFEALAASRNIPVDKVLEEILFPLVPQKRLLDPQEIADYVIFLASEKGKGVTGQAVVIDGGYTAQ